MDQSTAKRVIKMNELRQAIRTAQSVAKQGEWSDDLVIVEVATRLWDDLEELFKGLGGFE